MIFWIKEDEDHVQMDYFDFCNFGRGEIEDQMEGSGTGASGYVVVMVRV